MHSIALVDVAEKEWDAHMNVNVRAAFFLARAAAQSMKLRGGHGALVLLSSGAWLSGGLPERLPYATTKGAVTTMVRGLAKAYGPHGVTVNAVAPGLIDTGMMRDGLTAEQQRELEQDPRLRRFGLPEEVADVIVFLCSSRASFVSGATVNVSGGYTLY